MHNYRWLCTVAEEVKILPIAPLLQNDFLVFEVLKILIWLFSTTAVDALKISYPKESSKARV